jgi:uncharacterized lipoprotein YehR (DUF1307 family)
MAGKKPVSAATFHKRTQRRAKKELAGAKKKAQHYSKGDKLMKQVSKTLLDIAKTHPHHKAKKQAKLAIKKLGQAQHAFGSAGLCQSDVFNNE